MFSVALPIVSLCLSERRFLLLHFCGNYFACCCFQKLQAGLDSVVIWLQHPESHKLALFHGSGSLWAKNKNCLGNSCVEALLVMWRHKINLMSDTSECQSWLSFPKKRRILHSLVGMPYLREAALLFVKELGSPRKAIGAKEIIKYLEYYSSI